MKRKIFFLFLIGLQFSLLAQIQDADEAYMQVRQYAAEGSYDEARMLARQILSVHPEYHDVAVYLARIHAWEGDYSAAIAQLRELLEGQPEYMDAHEAYIDVLYWQNDWQGLKEEAENALALDPMNEAIREKYDLALKQLATEKDSPELMLQYYTDHFSKPYVRNWHMFTLGSSFPVSRIKVIPYMNAGFNPAGDAPNSDLQLNLDAYASLGTKNSLFLGYGFSPDGVIDYMPLHRAGAEIWQSLPAGYGISAGLRFFYWSDPFTFLTLSGEKYSGNYYLHLRSYIFFKEAGVSASYYLGARRYLKNKNNYAGLTIGYGTAPDEPIFVESDLERLNAFSFRIEFSAPVRTGLRIVAGAGYSYEAYDEDLFRHRYDLRTAVYIGWKKWKD